VSWEETQDGENCVLNGLILAITKRKDVDTRVRHRKWVDGKKVTIKPEILVGDYDSDAEPNEEEEPSSSTGGCNKRINVAKYTLVEMRALARAHAAVVGVVETAQAHGLKVSLQASA
jgi:hypothetical protein